MFIEALEQAMCQNKVYKVVKLWGAKHKLRLFTDGILMWRIIDGQLNIGQWELIQ